MKLNNKVVNLGCRLNSYESNIIKEILQENKTKNVTVINTCAVTNQAIKKSLLAIKRHAKLNPENKIFVTGCASEIHQNIFKEIKLVDRIIPNKSKTKKEFYKTSAFTQNLKKFRTEFQFPVPKNKFIKQTRALLQIQQGCDHKCTFCIIPSGRGKSISLPVGGIIENISKYLKWGYKEVILTGVDITSYGSDLPGKPKLGNVIKRVLKLLPNLQRLRLSSLDPAEIDYDLLDLIKFDDRILPHIHFSAQSGDDLILKRMKRRHNSSQLFDLCYKIKKIRPDITFGADLIVGFPTETDKNFINTCNLVETGLFSNLHIFPFSPMEMTPASRMPQVKQEVIQERTKYIKEIGSFYQRKLMEEKINSIESVLFENKKLSYTNDYYKVSLNDQNINNSGKIYRGKVIRVKLTNLKNNTFCGEIV